MPTHQNLYLTRTIVYAALLFLLGACERDTYTTWRCNTVSESKIPMVLRKAQMEFKGDTFVYCGSLGNQSYFDRQCPAQTNKSNTIFTQSSGLLLMNGQEFQCNAL